MPDSVHTRKGASKASLIPDNVLALLHAGELESVNLTEWQAVNHIHLVRIVLPHVTLGAYVPQLVGQLEETGSTSGMKAIRLIGQELLAILHKSGEPTATAPVFLSLANHKSDSVRCWSAYIIGLDNTLSLEEKLAQIKKFAADHHFGVREIAWMAIRDSLLHDLNHSIQLLSEWVLDADENIRRFAIEATRPRGVWCKHIDALKNEPARCLPLLTPVKSDPSKYVQDSVGNWLNDASKSQPDWVTQLCDEWLKTSDTKETKRIVTKAKRTILKTQTEQK
ncbi:DNA alkylation repair protein [Brevibacillus formosus]|uniref:DNA alkylation repair protein n=1 Tax=Brevibacillus TaxID=55080 RepID=UPI000D10DEB6|nr:MULTISPECIES: DNA alkylation repair protein [Brevibacillus]MBG9943376.1 DNA alkylation repair protein [Brevibacillus formosus]MED1947914.1 DNA alkylation repair protein [Brevibacillus formosus]MED1998355.1 DNA alkylation repair protein [Brevibacillus formosus]MED2080896.1 DNA alkylation repair protein [Brevibacillus formosus]PSK20440.1 DNA alkylation repair protein [Brevibacillus sp. NRRL NRS-603]